MPHGKVLEDEKAVKTNIIELTDKLSRTGLREYTTYLSSPFRIFWSNFLAGTARGLGFMFGATVLAVVVLYLIGHYLANLPFVNDFMEWLQNANSGHAGNDWGAMYRSFQEQVMRGK